MMKLVYPYAVSDVSPNAIRSTHNPDIVYLGREPQRGNSGNHPGIVDGWCGTTSDTDVNALGEFDIADSESFDLLEQRIASYPIVFDRTAIVAWFDSEMAPDEDGSYQFPVDGREESEAFMWDENDEEFCGVRVRDGWQIVAGSDSDDDIECLTRTEQQAIDGDIIDWTEELLKAAEIKYDRQDHDTYSSETNGRDWAYIAVRDMDVKSAETTIRNAIAAKQAADDECD